MSYIRLHSVERDASGKIVKGSAAIYQTVYKKTGKKNHCTPKQIERLGKVIWMCDDKKSGIFLSKTRGLVEYDSKANQFHEVSSDDPRVAGHGLFVEPCVHTVFGDSYLLLRFMEGILMPSILSGTFESETDLQRFLCHSFHSILKEGARITCDLFVQKSVVSYLADRVPRDSLRTDTAFFTLMGDDKVKFRFFKA